MLGAESLRRRFFSRRGGLPVTGAPRRRVRDPSYEGNGKGHSFGERGWGIRLTGDAFKGGPNRVRRGEYGG